MGLICCNPIQRIVTGVWPVDPVDPPILSDYCAYWGLTGTSIFFPCVEGSDVNGNTSQGQLCGGFFDIADFQETGNVFRYANFSGSAWYAQMIVPAGNAVPVDMGYYAFDIFGNPSGNIPIDIITSNCFINCYTATFDVNDVNVDSFTQFIYNGLVVDMTGDVPFSDPGHDAWVLSQLVGWLEPSMTYQKSYVGTTVTITIETIMQLTSGYWGDGVSNLGTFSFDPC